MVSSLVLIFLLDHLPEHPHHAFNTSTPYDEYQDSIIPAQQCSSQITDPLVQIASKELRTLLIPDWTSSDHTFEQLFEGSVVRDEVAIESLVDNYLDKNVDSIEYDHSLEERLQSPLEVDKSECDEKLHKGHASFHLLDSPSLSEDSNNQNNVSNSDRTICTSKITDSDTNSDTTDKNISPHDESYQYENYSGNTNNDNFNSHAKGSREWSYGNESQNTYDNVTITLFPLTNETNTNDTDKDIETKHEKNVYEVSLPEKVPYLVAIFESLANVTAQTCGGTLVGSEWVLTAASCVNVLTKFYNENGEKTSYTIIVNATNPLLDGSAHNVTEILLHPKPSPYGTVGKQPVLALMRIEPKVDIDEVQIEGKVNTAEVEVMVYGWVLVKNDSGHDAMHVTSFPAVSLSPLQCRLYHYHPDNETLCLTTALASNDTVSQMTSGGPVLGLTATGPRLLALATTDAHAPLVAALLGAHAPWLQHTLRNG